MKTYDIYIFPNLWNDNFITSSRYRKSLHLIILKIFVIYSVINIIGNFLIKALSLIILWNWVKQDFLPAYQL